MEKEKKHLEAIIKEVYGDDFEFTLEFNGNEVLLTVPEDFKAIIIGKQGRNIKALRELFYVYNKLNETALEFRLVE